jgi:hypothetical protein
MKFKNFFSHVLFTLGCHFFLSAHSPGLGSQSNDWLPMQLTTFFIQCKVHQSAESIS